MGDRAFRDINVDAKVSRMARHSSHVPKLMTRVTYTLRGVAEPATQVRAGGISIANRV